MSLSFDVCFPCIEDNFRRCIINLPQGVFNGNSEDLDAACFNARKRLERVWVEGGEVVCPRDEEALDVDSPPPCACDKKFEHAIASRMTHA